jgi:hypothetical protein
MVCIVCLKENAPVEITMRYQGIQFETKLCVEHAHELQEVIRQWIRVRRDAAVIAEHEKTKAERGSWNQEKEEIEK